ncbi:PEP-CTERM sorting domain-containing protein [Tundrisphaera sp. TA3]|uniref:PEP-CTERM sorting domain-containing protein n=1 Tax=Tundrisphaera sp. TA3 TaxID=3435775 RepID=UPI003EB7D49F
MANLSPRIALAMIAMACMAYPPSAKAEPILGGGNRDAYRVSGGNRDAYRVTDLSSGSIQYDWDKFPVNYPDHPVVVQNYQQVNIGGQIFNMPYADRRPAYIQVASNAYGSIRYEHYGQSGRDVYNVYSPGGGGFSWHSDDVPVKDFNIHGQAVGTSFGFAMSSSMVDPYLDDNIAADLGIHLTEAYAIDDLGRILAKGTIHGETHDFLLTPSGLPTPTPEPSTIAFFAVGMAAIGIRAAARRRRLAAEPRSA